MKLSVSILSSDLLNLERDIGTALNSGADMIHLDVMDGHFVPNLTFGIPFGVKIKSRFNAPIDSHLMISNPDKYVKEYTKFSDITTIHWEAPVQVSRILDEIRSNGSKAGISINPGTGVSSILSVIDKVDFVLVMTVEPGFSGQKMINSALSKIDVLRDIRKNEGLKFQIGVDGGINRENIVQVASHEPDVIISASSVFNGDIRENINFLKNAMSVRTNGSGNRE